MYLKSPTGSKRFSSSLARDVLIAFRMTAELFSFRKEVQNRWIIIRNGATKLGLFPDLISASLLGATGLLIIMINLILQFRAKKDPMIDCY